MGTLRQRLGRNLRRQRLARELTQEILAARADTDPKYLGAVERGQVNIGLDKIELLAGALGVDARALLEVETVQDDRRLGRCVARAGVLFQHASPPRRRLMLRLIEDVARFWTDGGGETRGGRPSAPGKRG